MDLGRDRYSNHSTLIELLTLCRSLVVSFFRTARDTCMYDAIELTRTQGSCKPPAYIVGNLWGGISSI